MASHRCGEVGSKPRLLLIAAVVLAALPAWPARAQIKLEDAPFSLTTEGWVNGTGAYLAPPGDNRSGIRGHLFVDAAVRLLGLYQLDSDVAIGPRVVLATTTDDEFEVEQATALVQGSWGRFEIGRRQGLPDVLIGYSPNPYTFTSAEYGPASGISLDPDGGLPARFLTRELRDQVDALTYLGFTPALAGDRALKALYVSPRLAGFIFGLAYTPDASTAPAGRGENFADLLQSGVSYEIYSGQEVYRFGISYTFAAGRGQVRDLHSVSGGASVSLDDLIETGSTTIIGVNVSSDADTGLPRLGAADARSIAIGATTSLNYEIGPWILGGYYQFARAEGDVARPEDDELNVLQIGGAYRFSTHVRLFAATHLYDFNNEGGDLERDRFDGALFLLGLRATL